MILWVASYPRSGNRLCRAALRRVFGLRVPTIGWVPTIGSDPALRNTVAKLQVGAGSSDDALTALREFDEPICLKTHSLPGYLHFLPNVPAAIDQQPGGDNLPDGSEDSAALYGVRDGRDCLVSFARYLRDVAKQPRFLSMSYEEAVADLMRPPTAYGGWSAHVAAWRSREGPTEIIRFEDLVKDAVDTIRVGANALGIDLPEPRADPLSFEEMRERAPNPHLVRRGKPGSWRSEFPPDLLDEFWDRNGEQMEALGYPRE